ncbi:hypothetical protein D3C73_1550110 [compost metagenome]
MVLTGKVPPELENWSTMNTIAMPLPKLPKTETRVNTIVTNMMLIRTANSTNHSLSAT